MQGITHLSCNTEGVVTNSL